MRSDSQQVSFETSHRHEGTREVKCVEILARSPGATPLQTARPPEKDNSVLKNHLELVDTEQKV